MKSSLGNCAICLKTAIRESKIVRMLLAIVIVLVVGTSLLTTMLGAKISRRALTKTNMALIQKQMFLFIAENHRLPSGLKDLPTGQDLQDLTVDGWGVPIMYSFDTNDIVTLKSLCGALATTIINSNSIVYSFSTKDTNGVWLRGGF